MARAGGIYYTLLASLPALPDPDRVQRTPITRPRLEGRIAMLPEDDRRIVDQVEGFLRWARQPFERSDRDVLDLYDRALAATENAMVRELVTYRLELRIVLAGLRARARGLEPPDLDHPLARHVRDHWAEPDFRLAVRHGWIPEVRELIEARDPLRLERRLFAIAWRHLSDLEHGHWFSLEALLVYLAKWDIVARIAGHDAEEGERRFEALVKEASGERTN